MLVGCSVKDGLGLMRSEHHEPINLGQDRLISINDLVDVVAEIAGVEVTKKHIDGPEGVRGRNSDNSRLREVLGWEPTISLEDGLARTYTWIEAQIRQQARDRARCFPQPEAGAEQPHISPGG